MGKIVVNKCAVTLYLMLALWFATFNQAVDRTCKKDSALVRHVAVGLTWPLAAAATFVLFGISDDPFACPPKKSDLLGSATPPPRKGDGE